MVTQEEAVQALLEQQKKAGAVVRPLSEAPADIQAMAAEDAAAALNVKLPGRKPTPLWRVIGGGCFEHEDDEYACTILDLRLDVFLAFATQLQLYAEAVEKDLTDVAFTALARAYTIIHHKNRWWERWFRGLYFIPARRARNRMVRDIPARAIYTFLPEALAAYHAWVTGKKKMNGAAESPATQDTPKDLSSSPTNPAPESGSF